MLLFRRPLLTVSKKTPDTKRVCMHQVQLPPAKTAMVMIMIAAVTGTDMTATGLLILTDRMGTDTTATEAGTAAETAAETAVETAVETGIGQEASLANAAAGMGQGHP